MTKNFQKLMRKQVQESLNGYINLLDRPTPKKGWIRTIRNALGMSAAVVAQRLGCSASNVTIMEKREEKKAITLETLEQTAQAMGCKLVYSLVPIEPLDKILEKQARRIAQKSIAIINHSMKLEAQGLNEKQLKQQEDDLVRELLQEHPKKLWNNDYEV